MNFVSIRKGSFWVARELRYVIYITEDILRDFKITALLSLSLLGEITIYKNNSGMAISSKI